VGPRTRSALIGLLAVSLAGGAASTAAVTPSPPRVTLIGDSIPAPIADIPAAREILAQGIDLDLQATPCRTVDDESCPFLDVRPPNMIELVRALGTTLGPTVIVSVGYNDDPDRYAGNIEHALDALRAVGVTRVLWATLKVDRPAYAGMNDAIRNAAAQHPEVSVIDWNGVAQAHPEWFQPDGLHPNADGAEAMARLFHDALVQLGVPIAKPKLRVTTTSLPRGRVGGRYAVTLHAAGGAPPYRWSLVVPAPLGLRLETAGRLTGVPTEQVPKTLTMRVTDSGDTSSTLRLPILIRAAASR
jgi:hypothetical protein